MPRPKTKTLTEGELRIMDAVWRLGRASVRDVADALQPKNGVAYNTVQTMLGILTDKGYLHRVKEGRAFVYEAQVSRGSARRQALSHLVDQFFGGSSRELVLDLMQTDDLDVVELDRLRALLDERTSTEVDSASDGADSPKNGESA